MPPAASDLDDRVEEFSDDVATFGDRVALAREALGLDQTELARRLGVRLPTLRGWEEDRSEPRANKLQILAGTLNVPLIWLMSGEGEGPPRTQRPRDGRASVRACLEELRDLRGAQAALAARMARLERRLRAALERPE
jgi:transcriptional regulator with XRE-family HTH domain